MLRYELSRNKAAGAARPAFGRPGNGVDFELFRPDQSCVLPDLLDAGFSLFHDFLCQTFAPQRGREGLSSAHICDRRCVAHRLLRGFIRADSDDGCLVEDAFAHDGRNRNDGRELLRRLRCDAAFLCAALEFLRPQARRLSRAPFRCFGESLLLFRANSFASLCRAPSPRALLRLRVERGHAPGLRAARERRRLRAFPSRSIMRSAGPA